MKKLLLIGLVWTYAYGMQEPLSGAKRSEPEAELSDVELAPRSVEKIQKVEDVWASTKQKASRLSVKEKEILISSLDAAENSIALDLKKILEQSPAKAYTPGGTQRAKLFNAALNIKNVFLSGKLLTPLIADKQLTEQIITRLAHAYQLPESLAALALNTDTASAFIGAAMKEATTHSELLYILQEAADQKNIDTFNFFLKHAGQNAAEVINREFDGINPLSIAVRNNDIKLVERLLAVPGIKLDIPLEAFGEVTNVMQAAYYGYIEVLKKLIQAGANLNLQSKKGETALLLAVKRNRPEIVQILIDARADLNLTNQHGMTALMLAIENTELLNKLIQAGANLNLQSDRGATALLYALEDKKTESVQILIDAGADVTLPDIYGLTPLMMAIITDNQIMINKLIPVSHVTLRDDHGYNALDYAVLNRNSETVRTLLNGELRSLINEYDQEHNNPLINAIKQDDVATVTELLKAGARTDVSDEEGNAPLALAISNNNLGLAQALIKDKANLDAQNGVGITALMIAAERENGAIVEMLVAAGAQPAIKNNAQETAYDIAAKRGNREIMQKLQVKQERS